MPKLSIVVPFYNVERYFEECLASLERQTLEDIEVVMVDDGSPDNSVEIARAFAARDPRFKLVRQDNAGLGAARNTGTRNATGDFIAFVDSDDIIPPYAFSYMVGTLQETGSDFATGNVHRLNELGAHQSPMHRRNFRTTILRTHVRERDTLVTDRLSTNKVFRRSFWDENGFAFPEGVLYEDIACVLPAHFLARAIDVLPAVVYYWRERPSDDKSITQDRSHIKGLEDRVLAVRSVSDFLTKQGLLKEKRNWDRTTLISDLRIFLQVLEEASDEFRQRFLDLTNDYIDQIEPGILDELPAIERLKWYLVRRRRLDDLLEVVGFQNSSLIKRARLTRKGFHYYGGYPFFGDRAKGIPDKVYDLGSELQIRQKVERVEWDADRLVIEGRAGLRYLPARKRWQQVIRAWLVDDETGKRSRLPVKHVYGPAFMLPQEPMAVRMDWGGFSIAVDASKLRSQGEWRRRTWHIDLWMLNRGMVRTARLANPISGPTRRPEYRHAEEDFYIRPSWNDEAELEIRVEPLEVEVDAHRLTDGVLEISGEMTVPDAESVRLGMVPGGLFLDYPLEIGESVTGRRTPFSLKIPVADLIEPSIATLDISRVRKAVAWRAELHAGARRIPMVLSDAATEVRHRLGPQELAVKRSPEGYLTLVAQRTRPVITMLDVDAEGLLRIEGRYAESPDSPLEFVLRARGRNEERVFPLRREGERIITALKPARVASLAGELPLARGNYDLAVRVWHSGDEWRDFDTVLDSSALAVLPIEVKTEDRTFTVVDDAAEWPVLRVSNDLLPDETGGYAQKVLREEFYPSMRREPVRAEALFESYSGKQFSDSPRGIFEEMLGRGLDMPCSWTVRDGQVALPEGARKIRHSGREYFESLALARYIVTNAHLPAWFEHRPGQTVVQTWHGSMLKRIGFDIERVRFASSDYHDRLVHEIKQWDYLISPSPWATPILRKAFDFEGEILETGYPRNDVFFSPDRDRIAEEVRRRVGLPAGKKVILYAPTWRDDKFYAPGRYKLDLHLHLERLYRELGEDHVLMVRRHPNVVDRVPLVGKDFVFDVSVYPEVQELYLATDILITDYSSLMFDFANTRRPMLFFTYDLDEYRDKLRGFYFDFEQTAPGPLLMTSDSVIEAIKNIDEVHAAQRARYQAFIDQFCPLDDGKAAARVVDQVFRDLR